MNHAICYFALPKFPSLITSSNCVHKTFCMTDLVVWKWGQGRIKRERDRGSFHSRFSRARYITVVDVSGTRREWKWENENKNKSESEWVTNLVIRRRHCGSLAEWIVCQQCCCLNLLLCNPCCSNHRAQLWFALILSFVPFSLILS